MKVFFTDLIRSGGLIREKAIGWDQVEKYLKRAKKDLISARLILAKDAPVAMDLVYKSMFHSANALIRSLGLRPGRISQHKAVIAACERILGREGKIFILRFNKLRQKRNYFEYGAGFLSSKEEIKNSLIEAEKFIHLIEVFLKNTNPQKQLF
jgi:uncharacterized protein (UPF0332 family)